jgi:hypothetical protein
VVAFTGTMPIVIALNAFTFFSVVHSYFTKAIMLLLPSFSTVEDASDFISSVLVLCFVFVAEIWRNSWPRCRCQSRRRLLSDLAGKEVIGYVGIYDYPGV